MTSKLTGEGDEEDEVQKNIAIFSNKQWGLSIDMKTKVIHLSEWESARVQVGKFASCSACQEWVNERLKECESEKEWVRECESDFWA